MKTKSKLFVTLAATVVVGASTLAAIAQQTDSHNWVEQRVAKHIVARIEARLNMTAEQREAIKSIVQTEKPTILRLAASARQEREELALMPAFNEAQVREITQRYSATNAEILVERAKVRLEMRAVLNDAQRGQLDEMRTQIGSHAEERLSRLIDLI